MAQLRTLGLRPQTICTTDAIVFSAFLAISGDLAKIPVFQWLTQHGGGRLRFVETEVVNAQAAPAKYKVSESLRSTHGQDGAVVLDVAQGRMFSLNRVGARMLELMKGGAAESEIVETIGQEFGAKPETVEKDLGDFIAVLKRHKLINLYNGDRSGVSISGV